MLSPRIVRRVSLSLSLFVYVSRILSARAVAGDRAPSALQPWLHAKPQQKPADRNAEGLLAD